MDKNFEQEMIEKLRLLESDDFDVSTVGEEYVKTILLARDVILGLYEDEKEKNLAIMRDEYDKWAGEMIQAYHNLSSELNTKCVELETKLEKANEENKRLRDLYLNIAKNLDKKGLEGVSEYMLAQIDATPTFIPQ
jgi:hypothetical protein